MPDSSLSDDLGVVAPSQPPQAPVVSNVVTTPQQPVSSSPAAPTLMQTLGIDPSAVAPPSTSTQQPPLMPTAGPSGNFWTDLKRRAASAAADVGSGVGSQLSGLTKWSPVPMVRWPGDTSSDTDQRYRQPSSPDQMRANVINSLNTTYYQPETYWGRLGQAALGGTIAGAIDPATLPATIGGSVTSEAAREAFPNHPVVASTLGFLPGAWAGSRGANLALPPAGGTMDAGTAALAQRGTQMGVRLTPAQASNSPFVRYLYSTGAVLPGSGAQGFADAQLGDFTRATSRTFGEDADRITPEVMTAAQDRLGPIFNGVAQRTNIPMTNALMTRLQNVVDNSRLTMEAGNIPAIEGNQLNILQTAMNNNGNIGGSAYQSLTQRGGAIDDMTSSPSPGIRRAGIQFRNILDDELQSNATNPDDITALQDARRQWHNLKTVQPLTIRADTVGGATPSTGVISPAALRGAVNNSFGDRIALAPLGQNDLNDLARFGQRFLREPPQSGTEPRTMIQQGMETLGHSLPAMITGGLGAHLAESGQWKELAGLLGTAVVNRGVQSAMRSPWLVNRSVAASMNPNGFQFPMYGLPTTAMPFSLAAPTAAQPSTTP